MTDKMNDMGTKAINTVKTVTTLNTNDTVMLTLEDGSIARIKKSVLWSIFINDIKIGGRNYIIRSKLSSYSSYNTIPTYLGSTITSKLVRPSSAGLNFTISVSGYTVAAGEIYTISGVMKINGNPVTSAMWLCKAATTYIYPITFNVDDSTGRFVITTKYTVEHTWLLHTQIQGEIGDIITLDELKFERGNIPTDWTPAVEEMING